MRIAAAISVEAHNYAQEITEPGRYEYEIQAEMERLFRLPGGMKAYPQLSLLARMLASCTISRITARCRITNC